ncbi:retrovirus-related pol polyprotein from transposon TNT 1-94 [Tanacetum coccineum]
MATNEETNAAGTDTRPPMLVENDYESWKIRIHRYIRGKPNGKLIWKSIQNGPTPHPMVTDPSPSDSTIMPAPRKKLDSEFNEEENKLEMADTQAEIILSQGRTLQQRKEYLFDDIECKPVQRKGLGNVGNTGARGKKVICYNCRGEGHVARQCKEPKRKMDSQYFKDKAFTDEAIEKGDVLDEIKQKHSSHEVECTTPYDQPQTLTYNKTVSSQS